MTNKIAAAALLIGGTAFAQYPSSPGYPNYNPNYSGSPNYQAGPYNSGPYDSSGAYQQPYDGQYDPGQPGYAAPAPPPAPAYAYQPPAPGPGYLWIDGFWNFAGGRYVWSNGYWTLPPYGGSYWVAPRYYGGRFYGGHWGGSGFVRHENFRYTAPRGFDRGDRARSDFRGREGHGGRR